MFRSTRALALVAAGAATAGMLGATASPASGRTAEPQPITTGLVSPLQLDIGKHGEIYVAQSFAGILSRVDHTGDVVNLLSEPTSVSGVAAGRHSIAYTVRGDDPANPLALLKVRRADGSVRTVADLYAFEAKRNPDAHNRYGIRGLSASCADSVPPELQPFVLPYKGAVDSNPYALLSGPGGWFVADAGANAIVWVSTSGKVREVFTFRPQKSVITAEGAASVGLPECVVGKTFAFEPVPTDVEYTARGALVASLLPGGPEDASLGARGAIVRIGKHGFTNLARGFLGATNLAVGKGGRIYVAELFGNQISMYRHGHVTPVVSVPNPAGLEYSHGTLIASTDVFGAGNIVALTP